MADINDPQKQVPSFNDYLAQRSSAELDPSQLREPSSNAIKIQDENLKNYHSNPSANALYPHRSLDPKNSSNQNSQTETSKTESKISSVNQTFNPANYDISNTNSKRDLHGSTASHNPFDPKEVELRASQVENQISYSIQRAQKLSDGFNLHSPTLSLLQSPTSDAYHKNYDTRYGDSKGTTPARNKLYLSDAGQQNSRHPFQNAENYSSIYSPTSQLDNSNFRSIDNFSKHEYNNYNISSNSSVRASPSKFQNQNNQEENYGTLKSQSTYYMGSEGDHRKSYQSGIPFSPYDRTYGDKNHRSVGKDLRASTSKYSSNFSSILSSTKQLIDDIKSSVMRSSQTGPAGGQSQSSARSTSEKKIHPQRQTAQGGYNNLSQSITSINSGATTNRYSQKSKSILLESQKILADIKSSFVKSKDTSTSRANDNGKNFKDLQQNTHSSVSSYTITHYSPRTEILNQDLVNLKTPTSDGGSISAGFDKSTPSKRNAYTPIGSMTAGMSQRSGQLQGNESTKSLHLPKERNSHSSRIDLLIDKINQAKVRASDFLQKGANQNSVSPRKVGKTNSLHSSYYQEKAHRLIESIQKRQEKDLENSQVGGSLGYSKTVGYESKTPEPTSGNSAVHNFDTSFGSNFNSRINNEDAYNSKDAYSSINKESNNNNNNNYSSAGSAAINYQTSYHPMELNTIEERQDQEIESLNSGRNYDNQAPNSYQQLIKNIEEKQQSQPNLHELPLTTVTTNASNPKLNDSSKRASGRSSNRNSEEYDLSKRRRNNQSEIPAEELIIQDQAEYELEKFEEGGEGVASHHPTPIKPEGFQLSNEKELVNTAEKKNDEQKSAGPKYQSEIKDIQNYIKRTHSNSDNDDSISPQKIFFGFNQDDNQFVESTAQKNRVPLNSNQQDTVGEHLDSPEVGDVHEFKSSEEKFSQNQRYDDQPHLGDEEAEGVNYQILDYNYQRDDNEEYIERGEEEYDHQQQMQDLHNQEYEYEDYERRPLQAELELVQYQQQQQQQQYEDEELEQQVETLPEISEENAALEDSPQLSHRKEVQNKEIKAATTTTNVATDLSKANKSTTTKATTKGKQSTGQPIENALLPKESTKPSNNRPPSVKTSNKSKQTKSQKQLETAQILLFEDTPTKKPPSQTAQGSGNKKSGSATKNNSAKKKTTTEVTLFEDSPSAASKKPTNNKIKSQQAQIALISSGELKKTSTTTSSRQDSGKKPQHQTSLDKDNSVSKTSKSVNKSKSSLNKSLPKQDSQTTEITLVTSQKPQSTKNSDQQQPATTIQLVSSPTGKIAAKGTKPKTVAKKNAAGQKQRAVEGARIELSASESNLSKNNTPQKPPVTSYTPVDLTKNFNIHDDETQLSPDKFIQVSKKYPQVEDIDLRRTAEFGKLSDTKEGSTPPTKTPTSRREEILIGGGPSQTLTTTSTVPNPSTKSSKIQLEFKQPSGSKNSNPPSSKKNVLQMTSSTPSGNTAIRNLKNSFGLSSSSSVSKNSSKPAGTKLVMKNPGAGLKKK